MKAIGVTGCGSVLLEMHARELRELRTLSESLAQALGLLPDVDTGADGVVRVPEVGEPTGRKGRTLSRPRAAKRRKAKALAPLGKGLGGKGGIKPGSCIPNILAAMLTSEAPLSTADIIARASAIGRTVTEKHVWSLTHNRTDLFRKPSVGRYELTKAGRAMAAKLGLAAAAGTKAPAAGAASLSDRLATLRAADKRLLESGDFERTNPTEE